VTDDEARAALRPHQVSISRHGRRCTFSVSQRVGTGCKEQVLVAIGTFDPDRGTYTRRTGTDAVVVPCQTLESAVVIARAVVLMGHVARPEKYKHPGQAKPPKAVRGQAPSTQGRRIIKKPGGRT
jgi:hypothetical protein